MGLDWSTFLLELVNFLILIWILKRFLYAPVKAAVEARRQRVEAALTEADARRAEAEQMREDYQARRDAWEQERGQARVALEQELAAERARGSEALRAELQAQRDKAEILRQRSSREAERRDQEAALALAAEFASRLLGRLAGPELEARLVDMVIEDLPGLSESHRATLNSLVSAAPAIVRVCSAYPLAEQRRTALQVALSQAAGGELRCDFELNPELLAGLRIDAGALVMRANLRDELRFFAEAIA
jgi:F-type H+-transporting ATPase subunit b